MTLGALLSQRARAYLALGIVTACGGQAQDVDSAEAAIAEARRAFWDAHERGDADALVELATDDAALFAPGMEEVRGRDALRDAARQMFDAMTVEDFTIIQQEVEVHGSSAYELTTYSETLQMGDGDPTPVRGRYLIVWRQGEDGTWRVHRNLFHFITPSPFQ